MKTFDHGRRVALNTALTQMAFIHSFFNYLKQVPKTEKMQKDFRSIQSKYLMNKTLSESQMSYINDIYERTMEGYTGIKAARATHKSGKKSY